MVKKKIDNRIRVMIENGVKLGHRTMFLLVGDKSRDQVRKRVLIHQLEYNSRPPALSGLWLTSPLITKS